MSTTKLFRAGLIATVGVAGLTLSANAQSRYGNAPSVYDYESGRNCGSACTAPAVSHTASRYGAPVVAAPTYNPAPVYIDCVQAGTCAPQAAPVYAQPTYTQPTYTQPAQTYTAPVSTYTAPATTYTQSVQAPANCPSGTTAQSDGTCMQTSSSSFSSTTTSTYSEPSYSSSTTYSEPSYSSSTTYSAPSVGLEPVNCPSGTTAQSDGTCMQTGSSFSSSTSYSAPSTSSYDSGSSYSSYDSGSSYSSSGASADCPAGTTAQSDGTCMQGGSNAYTGSSIELYSGDASSSSSPSSSYGYGSSSTYSSSDYLPIRK